MTSPEQHAQLWLGRRRRVTLHLSSLWGRRGELGSLVAGQALAVSQLWVSQPCPSPQQVLLLELWRGAGGRGEG